MLFKDFHEIKVDPDRADAGDLKDKLLPLLVKMAYKNMVSDRDAHERKHGPKSKDEDAYNFEFTEDKLKELLEELVDHLCGSLKNLSKSEIETALKDAEKDMKFPLEED